MIKINELLVSPSVMKANMDFLNLAKKDGVKKLLVGGVILNSDNKILLIKRSEKEDFLPGIIELPSGHVDLGETLLEALVREIEEETNLSIVKVLSTLNTFDYYSCTGKLSRQINFLVIVDDLSKIQLNPAEHQEYRWCSEDETISWENQCNKKTLRGINYVSNNNVFNNVSFRRWVSSS